MAMYDYVKLCHMLTNGEPLYDAYTTYLPVQDLPLESSINLTLNSDDF